ncbi:hypothetical protein ACHAXN_010453 [Cyclotella atomus]
MGYCIALAGLLETFAFYSSIELSIRSKHMRHDFAVHAISSDRLQSWSSGGRLQTGRTDPRVDVPNLVNPNSTAFNRADDVDSSNLDETQLLLACRAYLSKKNKLKWQGKKVRREAAGSNEGLFWSDPDELVYLRDRPDPYNLHDNSTDAEEAFKSTYSIDGLPFEDDRVEYSMNPFSTNPLYPSEEHIKRSHSRAHFWSNETWKRGWYQQRWEGKKVTEVQRARKKAKRRVDSMPSTIINAPEFSSLSEEEVLNATRMYVRAREKMAESKRQLHRERIAQRDEFRQRRAALRREGEEMARIMKTTNSSRSDIIESSVGVPFPNLGGTVSLAELRRQGEQMALFMKTTNSSRLDVERLSFEPSSDMMVELKAKRSVKAKLAYRARNRITRSNDSKDNTKFRQSYSSVQIASDKSIQAIIRINDALDCGELPCISDVKAILKPGRLGRRKAVLLRILHDCFGLQGKCIPKQVNGNTELQFATTCSIRDLGDYIVSRLRKSIDV